MGDDGGGKLFVVPGQDALGSLQQRYPAAGFQRLSTLIYHHEVKVVVRKQLQGALRGSTYERRRGRSAGKHRDYKLNHSFVTEGGR